MTPSVHDQSAAWQCLDTLSLMLSQTCPGCENWEDSPITGLGEESLDTDGRTSPLGFVPPYFARSLKISVHASFLFPGGRTIFSDLALNSGRYSVYSLPILGFNLLREKSESLAGFCSLTCNIPLVRQ